jgi:hypothetical protein
MRQDRLAVELLKSRENDRFLPAQVPGLTGAGGRDKDPQKGTCDMTR